MKIGFFAIFDLQVKTFMRPWLARTFGEAERVFGDAVRDPKGELGQHAGDYSLFKLGEFDDETGLLVAEPAPLHCQNATAYVEVLPPVTKRYDQDGNRVVDFAPVPDKFTRADGR